MCGAHLSNLALGSLGIAQRSIGFNLIHKGFWIGSEWRVKCWPDAILVMIELTGAASGQWSMRTVEAEERPDAAQWLEPDTPLVVSIAVGPRCQGGSDAQQ